MRALVGLLTLLLMGCNAREAVTSCRGTEACTVEGRCATRRLTGDTLATCYADSAADCQASRRCKESGICAYEPSVSTSKEFAVCRAVTANACLATERCRMEGACFPADVYTCSMTPQGCASSEACKKEGRCAIGGDCCVADNTPPDRRCDRACRNDGACEWTGTACIATRDEDCLRSNACTNQGRCTADTASGSCVARAAESCLASERCRLSDACDLVPHGDVCARVEAPCDLACWGWGACQEHQALCQARDNAGCAASVACTVRGACHFDASSKACVPGSAVDCTASLECKAFNRCELWTRKAIGGPAAACVTPGAPHPDLGSCEDRQACEGSGACLWGPGSKCITSESAGLPPWRPRPRRVRQRPPPQAHPPAGMRRPGDPVDPDEDAASPLVRDCLRKTARNQTMKGRVVVTTDASGKGTAATVDSGTYADSPPSAEFTACAKEQVQMVKTSRPGTATCSFSYEVSGEGTLNGGSLNQFDPVLTRTR